MIVVAKEVHPPISVVFPATLAAVRQLQLHESVVVPRTSTHYNRWSWMINGALRQVGSRIKVKQSTTDGVTRLWRIE